MPLQNAVAADVAGTLSRLGAGQPNDGYAEATYTVDERTNALVLRGPRGRLDQLVAVIQKLDVQE